MVLDVIAQVLGMLGMLMNVGSFQMKDQRRLILVQLFGSVLFTVHFLLLGISEGRFLMGCALNIIGMARAYVYSHKERFHADGIWWLIGFVISYMAAYVLTFTLFGTPRTPADFIIEFLPVIGMTVTTVSFRMKEAGHVRALGMINSPAWLAYNLLRGSLGGSLSEIFCLISVIVGIVRLDCRKKRKEEKNDRANA